MGVEGNPRISEEKGLFPPFSGFSRCSSGPPEKGGKGRKGAKRADFGRFPGRAPRHPLNPHLLHPHLRQPKTPVKKQPRRPKINKSGHGRPRQGTEICNFGAPSPLEALHWIFGFFSGLYVQFSKTSPLKSGESSKKSSGENRVESCHVCGCHGFFGPDKRTFTKSPKFSSRNILGELSAAKENRKIK